jgi:hypothetical protein
MKNKWLIIAAVIVLVVLIGGGAYLMMSSKTKPETKTQTPTANTQTAKPQQTTNSLKGTIIGLLSGGKNVNCQVTYPDNKGTGAVYVSDKKFAGDFTMKGTDGKETTGHMISDGTYMYVWSSGMPMGIKMSLEAAKNAAQNAQTNQSVDINQEVGLNCSPWAPDSSKFALPTSITFRDMSQLLQQVQPQTTGTVAPQTGTGTGTSPCDQITNPTAKAACVNALQGKGY